MRVTKWAAALVCGMALTLPVVAQEDVPPKEPASEPGTPPVDAADTAEAVPPPKKLDVGDPPLHRWGGMTVAIAGWEPDLIGADEEIASTFFNNNSTAIMEGGSPHIRETIGVLYHMPKDRGSIGIRYDSMHHSDAVAYLTPSQFQFYESRAFPFFLGAFDDGFADGVTAELVRKTREFRLFYSQTAFETPRAKGTWSAGYRQLAHSRSVEITYLAIAPNLPPLIPPATDPNTNPNRLAPIPDQVIQTSNFDGHGIGSSLDLEFPIAPRVSIVSGLSIGLIRGSASSAYSSQSSAYIYVDGEVTTILTPEALFQILNDGIRDEILKVQQAVSFIGLQQPRTSEFAASLDLYLGLEAKVYKGLRIYGTVRDVYYMNVGEYVVPQSDGTHEATTLNVGYESYVLGLSWRF